MAAASGSPAPSSSPAPGPWALLRTWGILVFVFFLLTSAVGGSLASESSYLALTLASHIGLALVTLGLAGFAASRLGRRYRPVPRAASGLGALAALGATVSGTVFLVGGQSNAALYCMVGFAVVGLVASLLMIVFGGPSGQRVLEARPA